MVFKKSRYLGKNVGIPEFLSMGFPAPHNPEVVGSSPSPATIAKRPTTRWGVLLSVGLEKDLKGTVVNGAPVALQSRVLSEPAGESKSFPRNHIQMAHHPVGHFYIA